MATITFYGKPNCVNNHKQKRLLRAAGHEVVEQDILSQNWTPGQLRPFFGEAPVSDWFNRTAPAIKDKWFWPDQVSAPQALEAMMCDPLLIRRPLMIIEGQKICGWDYDALDALIGLSPQAGCEEEMQTLRNDDITTCPFVKTTQDCDQQEPQPGPTPIGR